MTTPALKLNVGDVIKLPGYGYPLYVGELEGLYAVLYPAWYDEKKVWHAMIAGFRLHTTLDTSVEKVN